MDNNDKWYKLDHAGKLFPSVTDTTNTSTFRMSMILDRFIDPMTLQEAVDKVIVRFPTLAVKLDSGLFWRYLVPNPNRLIAQKEVTYPCAPINAKDNNGYLLKVLYFENKISIEVFHALTDGSGAIEFLKTLVYQYLILTGVKIHDDEGLILQPDSFPSRSEAQNSFDAYYISKPVKKIKQNRALHIQGTRFLPYGHNVIHGFMSASQLNRIAKDSGVTINTYLIAILIMAVQMARLPGGRQSPIIVAVPVNLRNIFKSKSLRNFYAVVNIEVDMTPEMALTDLFVEVTNQIQEKTTRENLEDIIAENMRFEKNPASRFTPMGIKDVAIKTGFDHWGENRKTITLTNVGKIMLPSDMMAHTKAMETTIYPTTKSPVNCAVCSLGDELAVTFARNIMESEVIREFFRILVNHSGLEVHVVSNDWGVSS
ncbi:MAG: alcohol acetyltransferase [Clostridiales Family XIII bacterium]|nr:alcohol acetyltransferase [Clostridiales Family XIII bacterium]